jgi:ketosteroid isomerase-like protein
VSAAERPEGRELGLAARVERFHEVMEAWNTRDLDRMFSMVTDDVMLLTDPDWPGGGSFQGRDQILRFMDEFVEPWEDVRYETVTEGFEVGDQFVERGRWSATGRTTGIEGVIEFTSVVSFAGPQISRMAAYFDHDEALAHVGDE